MEKPKSVIPVEDLPVRVGSGYPPPYDQQMKGRKGIDLGNAFGLTQFGARITTLAPGAWSSQRHWHVNEDELVYGLEGEMVLVDDHGHHPFGPGMVAGFKANTGNGHHFINVGQTEAKFLVVGTRAPTETAYYSDIDMKIDLKDSKGVYTRKDGSPF